MSFFIERSVILNGCERPYKTTETFRRYNYLKNRKKNQTQAVIEAGYSPASASSQAYQLLQNPIVLEYLENEKSSWKRN